MKELIDLIFPSLCISCQKENQTKNDLFCVSCIQKLGYTDHFENRKNEFYTRFYGRLELEDSAALFWYSKGDLVQNMIYNVKYGRQKFIGTALGKMIVDKINESPFFNDIDMIVPVPLHPKKKAKRGFNQSELLVNIMSNKLNIQRKNDLLIKVDDSISQTNKSRVDRLLDIEKGYQLNKKYDIRGKKILLVDDVLTTGATLEACGKQLLNGGIASLSMITIGIGRLS